MIIVSGTLRFSPAGHQELFEAMDRMETATRAELGCRTYTFYVERADNCRFRVYEEWDSWDALEAHGDSAHMAEFREVVGRIGVLDRDIRAFEVGTTKQI